MLLTLNMLLGTAAGAILLRAADRAHLPAASPAADRAHPPDSHRAAAPLAARADAKPAHGDYCRCRRCPGEASCCCRPGPSATAALALAAACDSPEETGLRLLSPQPALLPERLTIAPSIAVACAPAPATTPIPSQRRVRPPVQPPRPL